MKTNFTIDQRSNPFIQMMEKNIRKCVHCGFCLPSCPTYSVLGDERESPRGRIYLIKDMLESGEEINKEVVAHVDSCLSCLACLSACPAGVDYQNYVDYARNHIENNYKRHWYERVFRNTLVYVITHGMAFKIALTIAKFIKPFSRCFNLRFANMVNMAPKKLSAAKISNRDRIFSPEVKKIKRVALLLGCAQHVLRPSINEATIRLLNRMGFEVVISKGVGCCGALSQHIGNVNTAKDLAKTNIDSWLTDYDEGGLDHIVINTAGCGTEIKNYAHMFKDDPIYREKAQKISYLARDISELISEHQLPKTSLEDQPTIIYHDACSLMHGQGITQEPRKNLRSAGFEILEIPGKHFCCGSAGSYNILQPVMANELKKQRLTSIGEIPNLDKQNIIATGNVGCLMQLRSGTDLHVAHTVELLDWATGGLKPPR